MSDGGAPASGGVWCRSAAASSLEARFCSCLLLPRRRWPPRLRLRRQAGFAGHARWHRFPVSIYGDDDGLVVFSGDAFWWILIRLLFPGCGVSVGVDGASARRSKDEVCWALSSRVWDGAPLYPQWVCFPSQRLHRRCRIFWAFAIDWWWRRRFPAPIVCGEVVADVRSVD